MRVDDWQVAGQSCTADFFVFESSRDLPFGSNLSKMANDRIRFKTVEVCLSPTWNVWSPCEQSWSFIGSNQVEMRFIMNIISLFDHFFLTVSFWATISIRFGPSLRYIELPIELITHTVLYELGSKCPNLTHMLLDFSTAMQLHDFNELQVRVSLFASCNFKFT